MRWAIAAALISTSPAEAPPVLKQDLLCDMTHCVIRKDTLLLIVSNLKNSSEEIIRLRQLCKEPK